MSTFLPAYRLTVMSPRFADATETTPLAPVGSAPHSDPFIVHTLPDVDNYVPYSEKLNNWTGRNCTITTDSILAPDGVDMAELMTPTVANGYIAHAYNGGSPVGNTFFAAVWLRAVSGTPTIRIGILNQADTGLGAQDVVIDTTWKRYIVTLTPTGSATSWAMYLQAISPTTAPFYAWAAQVSSVGATAATLSSLPYLRTDSGGYRMCRGYLAESPRGRRGRLDPRDRSTDTGTLSVKLIDKRTGSDNLSRWATGFLGDSVGRLNLMGLKCQIEESLDGGATWAYFYTGRMTDVSLDSKVAMTLQLRDMGEDLEQDIFAGTPHTSITYAARCPVWPRGVVKPYGVMPVEKYLNATVASLGGDTSRARLTFTDDSHYALRLFTQTAEAQRANMWQTCVVNDGGTEKWYLFELGDIQWHATEANRTQLAGRAVPKSILLNTLGPALMRDTRYAAALPVNANVTCYTVPTDMVRLSGDYPLLISDVHPCQLWIDILDGKFSQLANGVTRRPVAYDAAKFATLIADATFPNVRFQLGDGATDVEFAGFEGLAKMNDWIEANLCRPFNLAYYLDERGRVAPLDLRRKSAASIVTTITDADRVESGAVDWTQTRNDAITRVDATYYSETQAPLEGGNVSDSNGARLTELDNLEVLLDLSSRTLDVGNKPYKIDAKGLRYAPGERMPDGTMRVDYVQRWLRGMIKDFAGPFSGGAQYITIACRRTANTNPAKPGTLHVIDVDAVPDVSTNRRGGARIALCVERTENGPTVTLGFLDLGFNATAAVPTVNAYVKNTADPRHSADINISLNAAGEACEVQFAITTTSVGSVPAATSALWMSVGVFITGGVKTISHLPVAQRVWARVRSLPDGEANTASLQQPSGFVNAGNVDLDPYATPGALTVSNITQSTADVTWTTTDTETPIEVLCGVGATPASLDDTNIVAIVPPNTRRIRLFNLDGPSVQHALAVRHRSPIAGWGPAATTTFSTTSSPPTAPRPAGIATHN